MRENRSEARLGLGRGGELGQAECAIVGNHATCAIRHLDEAPLLECVQRFETESVARLEFA